MVDAAPSNPLGVGGLLLALALGLGSLGGLGSFTFVYGKGFSYLSDDPAVCANCHVMGDHYDAWQNASHRHVATCNDCHLPPSKLGKWFVKADNGALHSLAFTLGGFPDPIRIKPRNAVVTQRACLGCHGQLVHALDPDPRARDTPRCASCHRAVGHAHR